MREVAGAAEGSAALALAAVSASAMHNEEWPKCRI
jgi:hypothetical protein